MTRRRNEDKGDARREELLAMAAEEHAEREAMGLYEPTPAPVDLDYVDADGFNDFEVNGVRFDHRPSRSTAQEQVYKVWWPGIPGAGRMYGRADGWRVQSAGGGLRSLTVPTKAEAVRRAAVLDWDPRPVVCLEGDDLMFLGDVLVSSAARLAGRDLEARRALWCVTAEEIDGLAAEWSEPFRLRCQDVLRRIMAAYADTGGFEHSE